jgi:hypothetical protein
MSTTSLDRLIIAFNNLKNEVSDGIKHTPIEFGTACGNVQDVLRLVQYTNFQPLVNEIAGCCRVRVLNGIRRYEYLDNKIYHNIPKHVLREELKILLYGQEAISICLYDILNYLSGADLMAEKKNNNL